MTVSRRRWLRGGLAVSAGAVGLAGSARLADRYGLVPPDCGGLFGIGETLTYASQRLLAAGGAMAREFERSQISEVAPVNGDPPGDDSYQELLADGFEDWRLGVDGLVDRPGEFSLAELKAMPARSQITMQTCEEGWSFIAEWTGVRLADLLERVGVRGAARYVAFFPYDRWWDSLDMGDALHPQTLLAWAMNGEDLSAGHGAPLRLKVPRQLGYKSIKYLAQITVVDSLAEIGDGRGSASPEAGYSWFAGI